MGNVGKLLDASRPVACPGTISGNQVTLKVTPQVLIARAVEIRKEVARIQNEFQNMTQAINRTAGYWNGDAANLHRKRYQEIVPEAEEMLRTLRQHAENLEKIAQTYITSEGKITTMSTQLPKNAIQ